MQQATAQVNERVSVQIDNQAGVVGKHTTRDYATDSIMYYSGCAVEI
jgi:hypothetical protein